MKRSIEEELRFTRSVLADLTTVVGKMKVPQTLAEAAMQVAIEIGPAYLAAKGLVEDEDVKMLVERVNRPSTSTAPTVGTAVGELSGERTQEDTARDVIDKLFIYLNASTFRGMHGIAFMELGYYRDAMLREVLKVLKGEL